MILEKLLKEINSREIIGSTSVSVDYLSQDSREMNKPHGLYFAVPGTQVDGHDFIRDVINKGTVVIVCERMPNNIPENVTFVCVKNVKRSMGQIASAFYGHPSREIKIIAVTGTNGKTSVVTYTSQVLIGLNQKPLLLSTAGDYFVRDKIAIERKAPSSVEIIELHRILREYIDQGATHCCLEATSIALDQNRLSEVDIDVALFTNLTEDHLTYHGGMNNYLLAKKRLFDGLSSKSFAIFNVDEIFSKKMMADTKAQCITFGLENKADHKLSILKMDIAGMLVEIDHNPINIPIIGAFNAYNILSVYTILLALNFSVENILRVLEKISGVPGRLEQVKNENNKLIVIDYAHTPDAIGNVLSTLSEIKSNKIITVFGCGGGRTRSIRPEMTRIAEKYSDIVILTTDNPRFENEEQIFNDLLSGSTKSSTKIIRDRQKAIEEAMRLSKEEDIVLVAGKGNEEYQEINGVRKFFSDRSTIEDIL